MQQRLEAKAADLLYYVDKVSQRWADTNILIPPQVLNSGEQPQFDHPFATHFKEEVFRTSQTIALIEALLIQPELRPLLRGGPLRDRAVANYDPRDPFEPFVACLSAAVIYDEVEGIRKKQIKERDALSKRESGFIVLECTDSIRLEKDNALETVIKAYFYEDKKPIVAVLPVL